MKGRDVAARTAIGLDIGTSGVRAAELTFGKSGITLEKFGQVALPEGAVRDGEVVQPGAVSEAIKQLWEHTKFSGKDVVVGVANQKVIDRLLGEESAAVADLELFIGKPIRFSVEALYTQEQFDIVLL